MQCNAGHPKRRVQLLVLVTSHVGGWTLDWTYTDAIMPHDVMLFFRRDTMSARFPVDSDDVKKVSTALNALYNDKVKSKQGKSLKAEWKSA